MEQHDMDANQEAELTSEPAAEQYEAAPEPQVEEQPQEAAEAPQEPKEEVKEVPFHEHPRWQEIQRQLRDYREEVERLKAAQAMPPVEERDPLLDQIREVNPEFADDYRSIKETNKSLQEKLAQIEARAQQREQAEIQNRIESEVGKLHEDNKVPEVFKPLYRQRLNELAQERIRNGDSVDWNDLPALYKKVHGQYGPEIEKLRASDRREYAKAKRSDAQPTPKQAPVETAKAKSKLEVPEGYDPRTWMLHQITQRALKGSSEDNI